MSAKSKSSKSKFYTEEGLPQLENSKFNYKEVVAEMVSLVKKSNELIKEAKRSHETVYR